MQFSSLPQFGDFDSIGYLLRKHEGDRYAFAGASRKCPRFHLPLEVHKIESCGSAKKNVIRLLIRFDQEV